MRNENIFLVSGRICDARGALTGGVITHVVCGVTKKTMREHVARTLPDFVILSVVNLVTLETTVSLIKDVVAGKDATLALFIEPDLLP